MRTMKVQKKQEDNQPISRQLTKNFEEAGNGPSRRGAQVSWG